MASSSSRIDPRIYEDPALDQLALEEYDEVTLADIVRTLTKRKVVLGTVFVLVVLSGVSYTALQTPPYESGASLVPLEHPDIIKNWLDSAMAASTMSWMVC